jgi:hypothetical protein
MTRNGTQISQIRLEQVWDRIDPLARELGITAASHEETLPYYSLRGPGFERLCYQLLVEEGESPLFFGKNGQPDHGVDIVVQSGATGKVLQCKNPAEIPRFNKIRDAVTKFEDQWLQAEGLPRPTTFIYCCPVDLSDVKTDKDWVTFRANFFEKTGGVQLEIWDRSYFDTRLRRLPDVVAGLFSDAHAELFCSAGEWRDDPWVRIRRDVSRFPAVGRFLDRFDAGLIYVPKKIAQWFDDASLRSPALLIRGVPGSGKTTLGLKLIADLRPPRHVYYVTLKDNLEFDRLWRSIRRRSALPSYFVVDDCHLDLDLAERLVDRLQPEFNDSRSKVSLLLLCRGAEIGSGEPGDYCELIERLNSEKASRFLKTSYEMTGEVISLVRPDLARLSRSRLERVHGCTAGDLYLLDEILATIGTVSEIDTFANETLYRQVLTRYFGRGTRHLPAIMKLVALAQFDLSPLAEFFVWSEGEKALVEPLMTEIISPLRYSFAHSSLADLLSRALVHATKSDQESATAEAVGGTLVEYFATLSAGVVDGRFSMGLFASDLNQLMSPVLADNQIHYKAHLVGSHSLLSFLDHQLNAIPVSTIAFAVRLLALVGHDSLVDSIRLLCRKFHSLFEAEPWEVTVADIEALSSGFMTLRRYAPEQLDVLLAGDAPRSLGLILTANGGVVDLFKIMENSPPDFAGALLETLEDSAIDQLTEATIASGRSVGTLHLAMRGMAQNDSLLLERLEEKTGAGRLAKLVCSNGNLLDLLNILQYSTASFAGEVFDALDCRMANRLIDSVATSGRSIEWAHHSLRALGPKLLPRLENLIGVDGWWRLIRGRGTLHSLSEQLSVISPEFRAELIAGAEGLSDDDWYHIISRGWFNNACCFIEGDLAKLPDNARARFAIAMERSVGPLAQSCSWSYLKSSEIPKDDDSPEAVVLVRAFKARIRAADLDQLEDLPLGEAASAFALLWVERQDLRQKLKQRMWAILPPVETWPQSESWEIGSLRSVLWIARSDLIALEDADRLAEAVRSLPLRVYSETESRHLFLLIWNLASLWYERLNDHSFTDTLPKPIVKRLTKTVLGRSKRCRSPSEKSSLFALAATIDLIAPDARARLCEGLRGRVRGLQWVREEANQLTFVPAYFALRGLSLIDTSRRKTLPLECLSLLRKAEDYEERGPAIDCLCEKIRRMIRCQP